MATPEEEANSRRYPLSALEVARLEGCALRTVQNWAGKNGVRTIGGGNRAQFLFFEGDIARFRQRERPGRRWPRKE